MGGDDRRTRHHTNDDRSLWSLLKLNLDIKRRSMVERLLAEAEEHLVLALLEREQ
jgi:hypothetical protein